MRETHVGFLVDLNIFFSNDDDDDDDDNDDNLSTNGPTILFSPHDSSIIYLHTRVNPLSIRITYFFYR
jgi:hypothetical protein